MSLLLRGGRTAAGVDVDVLLEDATIAAVEPAGTLSHFPGAERLDVSGHVVLPAFAEPHAHLDKAFTADLVENPSGDLPGAIEAWHAYRRTLSIADIAARARAAALTALERGVTAIRTHVDVGEGIELRGAQALIAVRDELRGLVDIQVAALSYPLTGTAGAANRERLDEALRLGVDVVGGAPHIDPDPPANLRWTLDLAAAHGRPVDLHMDEHLRDAGELGLLADLVSRGFSHQVAASHCSSLGMCPLGVQEDVAAAVARAGLSVITLPLTNLYLQGRHHRSAIPRGITALRALLDAGVELAGGGDNVQDPFNPLGTGDPLHTAQLLVAAGHLGWSDALRLVGPAARRAMGLAATALEPGQPADLVAVAGASAREIVATAPEQRTVIRHGRVVARTHVHKELRAWRAPAPSMTTKE